jgi:hypothetical protein
MGLIRPSRQCSASASQSVLVKTQKKSKIETKNRCVYSVRGNSLPLRTACQLLDVLVDSGLHLQPLPRLRLWHSPRSTKFRFACFHSTDWSDSPTACRSAAGVSRGMARTYCRFPVLQTEKRKWRGACGGPYSHHTWSPSSHTQPNQQPARRRRRRRPSYRVTTKSRRSSNLQPCSNCAAAWRYPLTSCALA